MEEFFKNFLLNIFTENEVAELQEQLNKIKNELKENLDKKDLEINDLQEKSRKFQEERDKLTLHLESTIEQLTTEKQEQGKKFLRNFNK